MSRNYSSAGPSPRRSSIRDQRGGTIGVAMRARSLHAGVAFILVARLPDLYLAVIVAAVATIGVAEDILFRVADRRAARRAADTVSVHGASAADRPERAVPSQREAGGRRRRHRSRGRRSPASGTVENDTVENGTVENGADGRQPGVAWRR
jgi:hypothetical protein